LLLIYFKLVVAHWLSSCRAKAIVDQKSRGTLTRGKVQKTDVRWS